MGLKRMTHLSAAVSLALFFVLNLGGTVFGASAVSDDNGAVVINLSNEGQKNIIHSSSFEAQNGQALILEINSSIKGTVDLFFFSPSNEVQRITIGGVNETKTVNLSEGRWSYNCTGFFDSGDISIVGTLSFARPEQAEDNPVLPDMTAPAPKDAVVINLSNEGQKNIIHSSSFEAQDGQALILEINSSIKGGVDLFLYSPSNEVQRIAIGGVSETKTVNLSEGRWSYNCTGFFDSGDISIVGTLSPVPSAENSNE